MRLGTLKKNFHFHKNLELKRNNEKCSSLLHIVYHILLSIDGMIRVELTIDSELTNGIPVERDGIPTPLPVPLLLRRIELREYKVVDSFTDVNNSQFDH